MEMRCLYKHLLGFVLKQAKAQDHYLEIVDKAYIITT